MKLEYGGGGFITSVGGRPRNEELSLKYLQGDQSESVAKVDAGATLQGLATVYMKPHYYQKEKRFEVFEVGCFAKTLLSDDPVRLLLDHDEGQVVSVTGAGLELYSDKTGLAFRSEIPDTSAGVRAQKLASSGCAGMSVGYRVHREEKATIAGEECWFIKEASLYEITICRPGNGAVKEAFAYLSDPQTCSLRESMADFAVKMTLLPFRRSLHKIVEAEKAG